jgi:general secretion pathway protein C
LSWATAGIWTLAAASVAFWVLRWPSSDLPLTVNTATATSLSSPNQGAQTARALGQPHAKSASPVLQASSQYKLMGVIASASGQGSALIATDGQPPKAYRVGQSVQDGWNLVALTARQARLRSSGAEILLELPVTDNQ